MYSETAYEKHTHSVHFNGKVLHNVVAEVTIFQGKTLLTIFHLMRKQQYCNYNFYNNVSEN